MPVKIAEERQVERQWMILKELDRCRAEGATKRHLADLCHVSIRTIERDMLDLSLSQFPIIKDKMGRVTVWKLKDGYKLPYPEVKLNPSESLSLILAEEALSFLAGTPHNHYFRRAMSKLRQSIPAENDRFISDTKRAFAFRFPQLRDMERLSSMISIAEIAYRQQKRLQLTYRSASSGKVNERKVDPYGIYYAYNALRLVGYCHLRKDVREFNFDGRLRHVLLLSESFDEPENFDLATYTQTGFGGIRNRNSVSALVHVGPPVSRWVKQQNLPGLKNTLDLEDDWIELHFETDGEEGLLRQVLAWGSCVKVLGSEKFKSTYQAEVLQMYRNLI